MNQIGKKDPFGTRLIQLDGSGYFASKNWGAVKSGVTAQNRRWVWDLFDRITRKSTRKFSILPVWIPVAELCVLFAHQPPQIRCLINILFALVMQQ